MIQLFKRLASCLIILFTFIPDTQAQFELTGSFRPRTQMNNGFRRLPAPREEAALVFTTQSRIKLGYKYEDKLKLFFSLQDARVWGDQDDRRDQANTGMYQAWGEFFFSKKVSLKAGRQGLRYDDGYLLTDPGWLLNGRSYDAAIIKFQDSTFNAHLGISHNQDRIVLNETRFRNEIFKNLHWLWLNKTFDESRASFILINRGLQREDSTIKYTQTFGPNIKLRKGNKSLQGIFYYQTGQDTLSRDVNAWMFSIKAGISPTENLELEAGFDMLSGTDGRDLNNPDNREVNGFDNLYGYRHKYFGIMDYFYRGFLPPSGLQDYIFKAKLKTNRLVSNVQLHSFFSQATVPNPESPMNDMDKYLGFEVDLIFNYKLNDITQLKWGYAQIFSTETMEVIQGGGNSDATTNFAYIELMVRPNFLSKK